MEGKKLISIQEAVKLAGKEFNIHRTVATMINWCRKYGIGHQLGSEKGEWVVDPEKLRSFCLTGKAVSDG